jgi:signal transduction histidine kinase
VEKGNPHERPAARGQRAAERRLLGRSVEADPRSYAADVQGLLAQALAALVRETRSERAAAWSRDPAGAAVALASHGDAHAPSERELALLAGLAGPTDLEAGGDLARLARESGFSSAAPVRLPGGETAAVLLLGGGSDPQGAVRPRVLAALAAAAARLEAPLGAAAAAARLARVGEEVRRLDRLAALGDLVAEIVHEIRNPLVSVKTFLQLLPERAGDAEFRDRFREVASQELRRIERLLDLVLAHARPSAPARDGEGADAAEACESVVQLVSNRAADLGVGIELDTAEPAPRVALSGDALRQVVLNLTLNALDATPSGGRVLLTLRGAAGAAELCVDDQGPGVALELRERLFEPFFSTRRAAPGGLGLAISRRIVEEAGGSIRIEDAATGGTRLRVSLPPLSG